MSLPGKFFFAAGLMLGVSLCQQPVALAGVYEDVRWAAEDNNATDMAKLLAKGADPNTPDAQGNTLLMVAVRNKNAEIVDLLIKAGARLNLRNKYVKGAEINHKGWNPLLYAAIAGHTKIVQLLLEGGAKANSISDNGSTPLMMAARGNYVDTAKVLLENGADPNIRNELGKTALDWALSKDHQEVAELLKTSGATE